MAIAGCDDEGRGALPSLLTDIAKQIADVAFRPVEKQGGQGQHLALAGRLVYIASQALHGRRQLQHPFGRHRCCCLAPPEAAFASASNLGPHSPFNRAPSPPPRPSSRAARGGCRGRGGGLSPGARPRPSSGREEDGQGRPQDPRSGPWAEGTSMAAAIPGLRRDPSFLRAATRARPSYGSPVRSPEGRALPGWRMTGASPRPRPAGPQA